MPKRVKLTRHRSIKLSSTTIDCNGYEHPKRRPLRRIKQRVPTTPRNQVISQVAEAATTTPGFLDAADAELQRRSLAYFMEKHWHILEPGRQLVRGWALDAIIEHLEAVTRGDIRKLLICVPPGSTKSLTTRAFWPAWTWIQDPSWRFIGASYAEELALRDNRRAKMLVTSDYYNRLHPQVRLADDQQLKSNFQTTATGGMMATSVRGRATGERGDTFVVDDPHNVLEAESDKVRKETLKWFREVVPSRVNDLDLSSFIVIMQRVHHEDVAAAAIEMGYEKLIIPMHYDTDRHCRTSIGWEDPRTEPGELMWPERFSANAVEELQTNLGPYAAAAQLEQSPTPREGGLFKVDNINYIDSVPEGDISWARGWDLAGTEGDGAYTAGTLVGYNHTTKRTIIAHSTRDRRGPHRVREMILNVAETDGVEVPLIIPQDPGQAGKAQARDMSAHFAGYVVRIELQTGSKVTRADPFASQVEGGNVDMVRGDWNREFLEEMRHFPLGKYKDQVDAASSAFNHVAPKRRKRSELELFAESVPSKATPR